MYKLKKSKLYFVAAGLKRHFLEYRWKIKLKHIVLSSIDKYNEEQKAICDYIKKAKGGVELFNYNFINDYTNCAYPILFDENCGLYYSIFREKKMYFKRSMKKSDINRYMKTLFIEQDIRSPHRYMDDSLEKKHMRVVVDCGVAEGNFALTIIDDVDEIYMFECDREWIEALNYTFAPYINKVHIIEKFVSEESNGNMIKLDDMFKNRNDIDLVKMDIEGEEEKALLGTQTIMKNNPQIQLLVCAYHNYDSEQTIKAIAERAGYTSVCRDGYMVFIYDKNQKFPYFRRGVLKILKSKNK